MKFFTMGGAFSVDRDSRIKGISWFPEELPSEEEYEEAWSNLEKNDYKVDYIITHTGPTDVAAELGFSSDDEAERLTNELQRIAEEVEFSHWFFGHYHIDDDLDETYHCLLDRVIDLADFGKL